MLDTTTIENANLARLGQMRRENEQKKSAGFVNKTAGRVQTGMDIARAVEGDPKAIIKLADKLKSHWLIIATAAFFDFSIGMIPILSGAANIIFGMILYLHFGGKGNSKFLKTGLLMGGMSIVDLFPVLSFLPVCLSTTLSRIIWNLE